MTSQRATSDEDIDTAFGPSIGRPKVADRLRLLAMAQPDFRVLEDFGGNPYMRGGDLRTGALGTWRLNSMTARNWLTALYISAHATTPAKTAVEEAISALRSDAAKAPPQQVNLRVGRDPMTGDCYIDMGNDDWTVVKFDVAAGTWDIVPSQQCPVLFRRTKDMLPLPIAVHDYGEGIENLRRFINLAGADNFEKYIAFLLSSLQPTGPYAGLAVSAKKESGKSQLIRRGVQLIDPNVVEKNVPPRRDADLITTANNRHLLSFDNISFLTSEVQDLLSILSTGGGKQERGFHQQDEVHTIDAMRPWATTGIGDYITKSDTLRRTFLINPPPLRGFITEADLEPQFAKYAPMILGHLYTAFAVALKTIKDATDDSGADAPATQTTSLADIERLMEAAGPTFGWEPGRFTDILHRNATTAAEAVIESNSPLVDFMTTLPETWDGTAGEFLARMNTYYEHVPRIARLLPKDATRMSRALADVTDELRATHGWSLTKTDARHWSLIKPATKADEEPKAWWEDDDPQ